jgi:hypothetical protein
MPNTNRTIYLSMELDDAIGRIAQKTKKSRNRTFNDLLRESPTLQQELKKEPAPPKPTPPPEQTSTTPTTLTPTFRNALGVSRKTTLKKERET